MGLKRAVLAPATAMIVLLLGLPTVTAVPSAAAASGCARSVGPVRSAPGSGKTVALTFDDGPTKYTPQILRILRRNDVRATFFSTGRSAAAHPQLLQQVAAEGHLIAGHTYDHDYPQQVRGGWTSAYIANQLERTNRLLVPAVGRPVCFFRPPGGYQTSGMYAALRARGTTAVMWSVDSEDWKQPGSTKVAATRRIVSRATAGSTQSHPLVLFHDGKASHEPEAVVSSNRSNTVAALPAVIAHYRARGYRFVTLAGASGLDPEHTTVSLTAEADRVPAGARVILNGSVSATTGPVAHQSLRWLSRRDGATTWTRHGTLTTTETGRVRVAVRPEKDTEYRLELAATNRYRASSDAVTVSTYTIPTAVSPSGPATVTEGETATFRLVVTSAGEARAGVVINVRRTMGSETTDSQVTTDSAGRAWFTDQPTTSARYSATVGRSLPFEAGSADWEVEVSSAPPPEPEAPPTSG